MVEKIPNKLYERELARLQEELVKMEEWIFDTKARVAVVFEGRDAAGKGGVIKRITEHLNPRITEARRACRSPPNASKAQWYFQRYIANLPTGGETVLFDRSWYNRAGVERVLGSARPRSTTGSCDSARSSSGSWSRTASS